MNKEVIKAMNKRETKIDKVRKQFRKWWSNNGYKVMRVTFFPVWLGITAKDKITFYLNSKEKWNEEKANEILSYYIPHVAEWDNENKSFYFFDNGCGWSINYAKRHLKKKDRRFWKVNTGLFGGEMKYYLINKFELEGFKKENCACDYSYTEIVFTMIENN